MDVGDCDRAKRKLSQIGYYRLSGFWYSCREFEVDSDGQLANDPLTKKPRRRDTFMPGTTLEGVLKLYRFDKNLRLVMLDAIERIEVHLRTVTAHELGRIEPVAHEDDRFINPRYIRDYTDRKTGKRRNRWKDWHAEYARQLDRCCEDCILWHKQNHKTMPFWVVVESWSFGLTSRYYGLLKGRYQKLIAKRFDINNASLFGTWLCGINDFRNRCAHHSRIWNHTIKNPLPLLNSDPFLDHWILGSRPIQRLYGVAVVIARLMATIGPNSQWFKDFADLLERKPDLPGCDFTGMGL
ncbi:MAG: Abi family protein, partial [Aphanocapsa feldmannii 288cV]